MREVAGCGLFVFSRFHQRSKIEAGVQQMLVKMSVRVGAAYIGAWAIVALAIQLTA
jgi:hypothetical protein